MICHIFHFSDLDFIKTFKQTVSIKKANEIQNIEINYSQQPIGGPKNII